MRKVLGERLHYNDRPRAVKGFPRESFRYNNGGLEVQREGQVPARKYPWEEWFARQRCVLLRGVHYHRSQSAMCQMVRNNACQRGVSVRLTDTGTEIIVEVIGTRKPTGGIIEVPRPDTTAVTS